MAGSTLRRAAPWRSGASWQLLVVEGVVLVALGLYLLVDRDRGELVLGLALGGFLLLDGLGQLVAGLRRGDERPRARELTLLRGGIGLTTGAIVLGLAVVQGISVAGIRLALALGGLPYGVIGLLLVWLGRASHGLRPGLALISLFLVVLAAILFYSMFVPDPVTAQVALLLSAVTLAGGAVILVVGLVRARSAGRPPAGRGPGEPPDGAPPTATFV